MPENTLTLETKLELIVKALDSKKAEDIKVLKVGDITILADYFVIADGTSNTQTKALAEEAEYRMSMAGVEPVRIQGAGGTGWVILDYSDIVVHVFTKEQRDFYNLERLWRDGEEIDISKWLLP